jgi:hypothetical protein
MYGKGVDSRYSFIGILMGQLLIGCQVVHDHFLILLGSANKVSLIIDLYNNRIDILLHDMCGGTTLIYPNESLMDAKCVGLLNEYIRLCYASKEVCLTVIPSKPVNEQSLSSMAQGLASEAKQMTEDFANNELYPKLQKVILESVKSIYP